MTRVFQVGLLVAAAAVLAARADDAKPKADESPIKAKLVAKKTTYTLDLGGQTAEEYKKAIKDSEKTGKPPAVPTVEMELELTNTSGKDVQFYDSGDPITVELVLKGPGAMSVKPLVATTSDFRLPRAKTLAAGKSYTIKISNLRYGFRGIAESAYWTEPGEYTLSAEFRTSIKPPPEGVKPDENGFGKVTLKSEPVKIKVEKK